MDSILSSPPSGHRLACRQLLRVFGKQDVRPEHLQHHTFILVKSENVSVREMLSQSVMLHSGNSGLHGALLPCESAAVNSVQERKNLAHSSQRKDVGQAGFANFR